MTYSREVAAVSFGDTKTAALYFDRVLPVEFRILRGTHSGIICDMPDPMDVEVVVPLIFGDGAPRHLILSYLDDYWSPFMKSVRPVITQPKSSNDPEAYSELKRVYLDNAALPGGGSIRAAFGRFASSLGVRSYSVLLPDTSNDSASFAEAYACLAASRLQLVDTSRASWPQVMELRADPEARAQLRRLRLFFLEHYEGKTRAFIEDDLLRRLDDYERARRKHGFETITSTLSVLLDAKTLQAAAVAGISTALFGGPISGMSAGAAVELGKVVLEVSKRRAAIKDLAEGHDLGYVLRAKDNLNP